jgi:hypothetical protein
MSGRKTLKHNKGYTNGWLCHLFYPIPLFHDIHVSGIEVIHGQIHCGL